MRYRQKDVFVKEAEGPSVRTIERPDGTAKVKLEFATTSERAGVKTTTWHHVTFDLDYDEIACVASTLAGCLAVLQTSFNDHINHAKEGVRRQLNG